MGFPDRKDIGAAILGTFQVALGMPFPATVSLELQALMQDHIDILGPALLLCLSAISSWRQLHFQVFPPLTLNSHSW